MQLMMSHLTGSAMLDQGPDHHSFLGLLFNQTEAKIYMILDGCVTKTAHKKKSSEAYGGKVVIFPLGSKSKFGILFVSA